MNIEGFHFSNGFRCSDVHILEKLNIFSINIFELSFHQDHIKWRHKLMPLEISKNKSGIVFHLFIYKIHYVLIKQLNVFLGNHNCHYVCRRCLSSYRNQNVSNKQNQRCEQQELTSIRTSNVSHLYWKKHFHKNPIYFRIYAVFEADNEIDNSSIGSKTTSIYNKILYVIVII